jgi:hypothetical protein
MHWLLILARLVVPISILRYPLVGGVLSLILDGVDWHLTGNPNPSYQIADKILDFYYLTIEAYVCLSWKRSFSKKIALALYSWRLIGITMYTITANRLFLVFFPNIFENFFLFVLLVNGFLSEKIRIPRILLWIGIIGLSLQKIVQEYQMHMVGTFSWRLQEITLFNNFHLRYDFVTYQILFVFFLLLAVRFQIFFQPNRRR